MQTDCLARNIVTWAIIDAEALQKCQCIMTHILVKIGKNIFGVCVRACCQKRGLMLEFKKHKDQRYE